MTKEIKYPEEIQEARFKEAYPEVNPHCVIVGCCHPGATVTEFCPYHKEMFDFQTDIFKKDFIRKYSVTG